MAENLQANFQPGKLYLIPTTLGEQPPLETLPLSVRKKIEEIDYYIAENEKTARRFIKKIVPNKSQPSLHFQLLNKFTEESELPSFLDPCSEGINVGVLSEAGCPGIADPGADIVRLAHEKNIQVVPLVGPSSIFLTMMSSGLNGQNFAFHGYLPIDKSERKQHLKKLERLSLELNQAQIFIETPYRNDKFFQDLLQHLTPTTKICIGCEVTLATEYIKTKTVAEWKKTKLDLHKRPAIFIIQKEI
ncbi:SAM-dependent methyltransferase [Mesonia maritima]|uniref:16S rRNA (Cytidine1402-2'-O)-methyltransferase n=1 Tax=Mesonia maritima TaxID=1793873 RepID=A0ABU1K3Z8_9FLAO|nr:SAM-dependent methyltransferase [Mesonia maritima]MDR6300344.1 16S rRNA (cytidine1402-2'-O)-methyltransferase [Mesonia maritima]